MRAPARSLLVRARRRGLRNRRTARADGAGAAGRAADRRARLARGVPEHRPAAPLRRRPPRRARGRLVGRHRRRERDVDPVRPRDAPRRPRVRADALRDRQPRGARERVAGTARCPPSGAPPRSSRRRPRRSRRARPGARRCRLPARSSTAPSSGSRSARSSRRASRRRDGAARWSGSRTRRTGCNVRPRTSRGTSDDGRSHGRQATTLADDEILTVKDDDFASVTADADGDDTDTTDGDADRRRRGRLGLRRRLAALERAIAPVERRAVPRRVLGTEAARRPARRGGSLRRPPLRPGRRAAGHRDGDPHAVVPARQGGRDASPATRAISPGGPSRSPRVADVRRVLARVRGRRPRSCSRGSTTPGCRSPGTAAGSRPTSATPPRRTRTSRRAARRGYRSTTTRTRSSRSRSRAQKRWLVYEPALELPLKNQRYRSALGEPGEPVLDVTRDAGDTLYLPRGWLHQALTSETDSLHITVGVNVRTWLDEARSRSSGAPDDLEFRRDRRRAEPPELPRLDREAAVRRAPQAVSFARGGRSSTASSPSCAHSTTLTAETILERRDTVIADLDGTTLVVRGPRPRVPARGSPRSSTFLVDDDGAVHRGGPARRARRGGPARARQAARPRGLSAT